MPRFRFRVEYDGAAFFGWQIQPREISVQQELENALSTALRAPIKITGAGRTDTGVHGRGQCAHFDWNGEPFDTREVERSVNGLSRPEVSIRALELAPEGFHARHDALWRYYIFRMALRPSPLLRNLSWNCSRLGLDPDLMEQEAQSFVGDHDFIDFCVPRNDGKPTNCILTEFRLERQDGLLLWHIKGNRFLHRQVRSMAGLLADVGRGKHPPGSVAAVFAKQFRGTRMWAPPEGLVLEWVEYPD